MMTTFVILTVVFVVSAILMVSNGIISYQSTSCPQYVKTTKWLTLVLVVSIVAMTILGIIAVNRTPDVKHVEVATECVVEETVEAVDSCVTYVEPVEKAEVHYATETATVPVGY